MRPVVCVVTGTRAEYGICRRFVRLLNDDPEVELALVVTGMHLAPQHGCTRSEIEADGIPIAADVEMLLSSDTRAGVTKSVGVALLGFADAFSRIRPDVVVLLGDRFETLAAAEAAAFAGVPVAHIGGGDATVGAMDEWIRHAITKMAALHLTATDEHRRRVIQMGEHPESAVVVGGPGVEDLTELELPDRASTLADLGLPAGARYLLVTFHPATADPVPAADQADALVAALRERPDLSVVLTSPNADPDSAAVARAFREFAAAEPDRVRMFASLGRARYLAALSHAAACVGNSSSGLYEAPSFGVPTVDIGSRQQGRERAESVIWAPPSAAEISRAIDRALGSEFASIAAHAANPFHRDGTAAAIVGALKRFIAKPRSVKTFYDTPRGE